MARGLKQEALGPLLGVNQSSVSRLYSGETALTAEVAAKAANYFGVRAGWLLFDEGEPWTDRGVAFQQGRASAFLELAAEARRRATSPTELTPEQVARTIADVDAAIQGHGTGESPQSKAQ